jgi:acyl dehydratase
MLPTDATLTHTEGKGKMTVINFTSDKPGNSFITTTGNPFINPVYIGATLKVQSSTVNPPGNYRGTFTVTFVRE